MQQMLSGHQQVQSPVDVDLVFTWVNDLDSDLIALRRKYASADFDLDREYRMGPERYKNHGELRAALRNSKVMLPFLRRTIVFGAGKSPDWLCVDFPDVEYILQSEIIPAPVWPIFHSDGVEAFIYTIPDLSEYYIYSNDDFFFAQRHEMADFFDDSGCCRVGIDGRFIASWGVENWTFASMETNAARALARRIRLPRYQGFGIDGGNSLLHHKKSRLNALMKQIPLLNAVSHVSQPYRKSTWNEFARIFWAELELLLSTRFRSASGFTLNQMYHHYSRAIDRARFIYEPRHLYLDSESPIKQRESLQLQLTGQVPMYTTRFCLNDTPSKNARPWEVFTAEIIAIVEGLASRE